MAASFVIVVQKRRSPPMPTRAFTSTALAVPSAGHEPVMTRSKARSGEMSKASFHEPKGTRRPPLRLPNPMT
jgi:hypothetical protein